MRHAVRLLVLAFVGLVVLPAGSAAATTTHLAQADDRPVVTVGTGIVALLAGVASPLVGRWAWLGYTVAVFAAFASGGPLTSCLLSLADASSRPGTPRVQRTILHGGSWIGALERLTMAVSILSGFSR